jgi:hypothetical protein
VAVSGPTRRYGRQTVARYGSAGARSPVLPCAPSTPRWPRHAPPSAPASTARRNAELLPLRNPHASLASSAPSRQHASQAGHKYNLLRGDLRRRICPLSCPPARANGGAEPMRRGIIIRVSGVRDPPPALKKALQIAGLSRSLGERQRAWGRTEGERRTPRTLERYDVVALGGGFSPLAISASGTRFFNSYSALRVGWKRSRYHDMSTKRATALPPAETRAMIAQPYSSVPWRAHTDRGAGASP